MIPTAVSSCRPPACSQCVPARGGSEAHATRCCHRQCLPKYIQIFKNTFPFLFRPTMNKQAVQGISIKSFETRSLVKLNFNVKLMNIKCLKLLQHESSVVGAFRSSCKQLVGYSDKNCGDDCTSSDQNAPRYKKTGWKMRSVGEIWCRDKRWGVNNLPFISRPQKMHCPVPRRTQYPHTCRIALCAAETHTKNTVTNRRTCNRTPHLSPCSDTGEQFENNVYCQHVLVRQFQ